MAAAETACRQPGAPSRTVGLEGLDSVGRAAGHEPAGGRRIGPRPLVQPDRADQRRGGAGDRGGRARRTSRDGRVRVHRGPLTGHVALFAFVHARSVAICSQCVSVLTSAPAATGRTTTRYAPGGSPPERACWPNATRSRRRMRLRTTAGPTRLEMENAAACCWSGRSSATTVSPPALPACPSARKRRKIARSLILLTRRRSSSCRESMAALAPPGPDDGLAGSVGHAVTEAVLACTTALLRLIGALHWDSISSGRGRRGSNRGRRPGDRTSRS